MSRVKVSTVKQTLGNSDIQEMFRSMMGEGQKDMRVVWPKFKKVRHHLDRLIQLIDWLVTTRRWMIEHFQDERANIVRFNVQLRSEFMEHFGEAYNFDQHLDPLMKAALEGGDPLETIPDFDNAPQEELERFSELYTKAMESDLVKTAVKICSNLSRVKTHIEDREKFDKKFLISGGGLTFDPIPGLPSANFKAFFGHTEVKDTEREGIMIFLHKLYHITHDVYTTTSAPDINVEDFIQIIMSAMDDLKKHIPRCDEAFNKITESVDLLRDNFPKYNQDMKISGNATIIMENFVLDVSKQPGTNSVKMRTQFRRIIEHYRKLARSRPLDTKAQSLFREIDRNFDALDKHDQGGGGAETAGAAAGAAAAAADPLESADGPILEEIPAHLVPHMPVSQAESVARVEAMTPEERTEHQRKIKAARKSRAQARKKAETSIDDFFAKAGGGPSDLCRELAGGDA